MQRLEVSGVVWPIYGSTAHIWVVRRQTVKVAVDVWFFLGSCHYLLIVQINPFRPNSSNWNWQSVFPIQRIDFRLVCSCLGERPANNFSQWSLNPLSAAPTPTVCLQVTLHCNQDFIPYCLEPMSRYKKVVSHDVLSDHLLVIPCHFHFWWTLNVAGLWFRHSSRSAHTEARACKVMIRVIETHTHTRNSKALNHSMCTTSEGKWRR